MKMKFTPKDLKPVVVGVALATTLTTTTIAATCVCDYAAVQTQSIVASALLLAYAINSSFNGVESAVNGALTSMESTVVQALDAQTRVDSRGKSQVHTRTGAQLASSAASVIQARGAIAAHQQHLDTVDRLRELREKLAQPLTTCLAIIAGNKLPESTRMVRAAAAKGTGANLMHMQKQAEPARTVAANYEQVQQAFCSRAMKNRGTCDTVVAENIQDGDIRAGLLFGDERGNATRDPEQEAAVRASIERLAGVRNQPANLPSPATEKTVSGKVYVETQRDYQAISQLASTCLHKSSTASRAQAGLGASLKSAGLATEIPDDISQTEALQVLIKAQMSPSKIQDMAGATQPEVLLRNMAQNKAFALWMQHSRMETAECEEAVAATTLALNAQAHYGERAQKLEAVARDQSGR